MRPLPGHLWFVKDQYGAYWNDEPLSTYIHVWYYRRNLIRSFPEFQFSLVMNQRDPSRPLPFYYTPLGKDKYAKEKEPTGNSTTRASDPTLHPEEDF